LEDFKQWLRDLSEVEAVVSENAGWRYIKMSVDTTNQEASNSYELFVTQIQPKIAPYQDLFNKKLLSTPFNTEMTDAAYKIYLRSIQKELDLYRSENIDLFATLSTERQKFGGIVGNQSIEVQGAQVTLQKAAQELKSLDRSHRANIYARIINRRTEDADALNTLFDGLVKLRHEVALNAGFKNYRDYKFEELGRFDYSVQDCYTFHTSIASEVVPVLRNLHLQRKKALGYDLLKPWDFDVDVEGKTALKPFDTGKALIEKTILLFDKIHPKYGNYMRALKDMGHLDLESKQGKMPGGYNYPLYETGAPFIFMNSVGSQSDLVTLPSEVAELASMSMELISMEHWDVIYTNPEELKRAKREQLEKLILALPWIATVDAFQHKIYEKPEMSIQERLDTWISCLEAFSTGVVDFSGISDSLRTSWHRQLHIFEVPFYYIEYGMAQLGAIAVWRNYKDDPNQALANYEAALALGYTKTIPEIYKTAGIRFEFSQTYVKELMSFVLEELDKLS